MTRHFPQYRGSRSGLFCDLSAGEFYPLRIPLARLGAGVFPGECMRLLLTLAGTAGLRGLHSATFATPSMASLTADFHMELSALSGQQKETNLCIGVGADS